MPGTRFWKKTIILGLMLLFLAPHARGADPSASERTLTAVFPEAPDSLDPHQGPDSRADPVVFNCYQRLTGFKGTTNTVVPDLAITWRISNDGRKYTFVLPQDRTFSDGLAVNADAVRRSFVRLFKNKPLARLIFPSLTDIQLIGPFTIQFILNRPTPSFLQALATSAGSIVSPGWEEQAPDFLQHRSLGSGPYLVESFEPGQKLTLALSPNQQLKPDFNRLVMLFEPRSRRRLVMLVSGLAGVAADLEVEEAAILPSIPDLDAVKVPVWIMEILALNCSRPWLAQSKARKAVAEAIQNPMLLRSFNPARARPLDGPFPPGLGPAREVSWPGDSVMAALSLLQQTGPPEKPLVMALSQSDPFGTLSAPVIQQNLQAVGLAAEIRKLPEESFSEALKNGAFDLALIRLKPQVPDQGEILQGLTGSDPQENPARFADPETTALLNQWVQAGKAEDQAAAIQELLELLARESPYLYLFQPIRLFGRSKALTGLTLHPARPNALPLVKIKRVREKKTPPPAPRPSPLGPKPSESPQALQSRLKVNAAQPSLE